MGNDEIINVIKTNRSLLQVIEKLNWSVSGTNYKKLRAIIKDNNISTDHFLTATEILVQTTKKGKKPINEILVKDSNYRNRASLKRRLINEGLMKYICSTNDCDNDGNWKGKKLSLILDHINGISNDNRLTNLRLLCPNCNATLPTHCGKNIK